ncbi:dienelactone hydrolase family protein [bacterium]|nr:dienelactone hydrolase family protein [bacterium]NUN45375.1 dienelactone hydrolase family protein [bacterium]
MKRIVAIWMFLYNGFGVCQDKPFVFRPPNTTGIVVKADILFSQADGKELFFDLYQPRESRNRPILIFLNMVGGPQRTWGIYKGWGIAAAADGLAAINFDTRSDRAEEVFDSLIEYLRKNGQSLGVDPDRIAVYAASANMNRGMRLMMDSARTYLKAGLAFYGNSEINSFRMDLPILVIRSGLDNVLTNSAVDFLFKKAIHANAPWSLINYSGGHHGFEVEDPNDYSVYLIRTVLQFAKNHLENPKLHESGLGELVTPLAKLLRAASDSVRATPQKGAAWQKLAVYQVRSGQYAECLASYREAIRLGSSNYGDMGLKALEAAAMAGNTEEAILWTSRLQEVGWIANWNILEIPQYSSLQKNSDYVAAYDKLRQRSNRFLLLHVFSEFGVDSARVVLARDISLYPKIAPYSEFSLNWIGYQLLNRQKTKEALDVFNWMLREYSPSLYGMDGLADTYEAMQDRKNSELWTKKCLDALKSSNLSESAINGFRKSAEDRLQRLKK